jgi:two-component system sensor histidine kinase QseC
MMILARAEASTNLEDRSTSIREVIASVIDAATVEARLRLAVSVDGADACCSIPREMLEAAIRNLVDNAIRYSPYDMPVEVVARFDSPTRQCRIVVADRGPGLSADQAAKIGQRFWRGDQGRSRNDGAGLGISIVHAIAKRFGGALHLKPREGGGLVAELVFPCSP